VLAHLSYAEVQARLTRGHEPYLAFIGMEPVAYGWVAREEAWIGELQHTLTIAPRNRYLWDFATRPAWRGQGVYPHLLQAIVRAEAADRFWIMHAPENTASGRGIQKAGFHLVGIVSFTADGRPGFAATPSSVRAREGAAFLDLPLLDASSSNLLAPCWCCTVAAREQISDGTPTAIMCDNECTCGTA
jgi:GNAT superfamily N-acetyltransferase